jgi:hypothetical protein
MGFHGQPLNLEGADMEPESGKETAHISTHIELPDPVLTLMAACLNILFHVSDVLHINDLCYPGDELALKK